MKKLNNKGFTLIELLAVIVILAIIMVVTIPTVLNSMGNARQNTFKTSANTVADWVEKEYSLAMIGGTNAALGGADASFTGVCISTAKPASPVAGIGYDYCGKTTFAAGVAPTATTKNAAPADTAKALTTTNYADTAKVGNLVTYKQIRDMLKASGVAPENYSYISIKVTSGRACVVLGAAKTGQFGNVADGFVESTGC